MDFSVVFEAMALGIARDTETFLPLHCLSHYWWSWSDPGPTSIVAQGWYPDTQELAELPLEKYPETGQTWSRDPEPKLWSGNTCSHWHFICISTFSFLMSTCLYHRDAARGTTLWLKINKTNQPKSSHWSGPCATDTVSHGDWQPKGSQIKSKFWSRFLQCFLIPPDKFRLTVPACPAPAS